MREGQLPRSVVEHMKQIDKKDFADFVHKHIGDATKCVVVFGYDDGQGGMDLKARQHGFDYLYEIQGFANWIADCFMEDCFKDEDCDSCKGEDNGT